MADSALPVASLLPQLACSCGISNLPNATPLITIEQNGLALCQCGRHGPVQNFLPEGEQ